jgi:urea carboxylase
VGAGVIEVVAPGTLTTVQDHPGRLGHWEVGVPPSGPMDDRSQRLANRIVGNSSEAAALENTLGGLRLGFRAAATVAVTGAPLAVELDGAPAPQWTALTVAEGSVIRLRPIRGTGMRAYVAVRGGIDTPAAMGSRSVFAAAGLGGRPLATGDVLPVGDAVVAPALAGAVGPPALGNAWTLRVVAGPHGAPDLLTAAGVEDLFSASWTVHHHSDRTGIRLIGPSPSFARGDGGDAGLHPSNILDSAYGVGTLMLAGDMAVVVGPDGPSLGGFVAFAQVIRADRWMLGQVRAGDRVVLQPVSPESAIAVGTRVDAAIARGISDPDPATTEDVGSVHRIGAPRFGVPAEGAHGPVTYRRAGEDSLLVELGEPVLDLRSRVRVHQLQDALRLEAPPGVRDLTPGVRSLHVQHDPARIDAATLLGALVALDAELPAPDAVVIEARTVALPLAWRHSQAMLAVERYQSIRADAPWCPDNIEFIRRVNGLPDEAAVREIVQQAAYLVLGLGDVYMGAPVAVPLDPRHRLVTTKYNPARTWTPANAVGIGGAFLCVYGMEGPGGYQLVGRTVPVWHDGDDPPWRLRHFDQLRFELVDEAELEELREASAAGTWAPQTAPAAFSLVEQERLVAATADAATEFRARREAAFAAERGAWAAAAAGAG